MAACGYGVRRVEVQEWVRVLEGAVEQGRGTAAETALEVALGWGRAVAARCGGTAADGGAATGVDTGNTAALLAGSGLAFPVVEMGLLARSVRYFVARGVLPAPDEPEC